jgi:hypothetical protein
MERSIQVILSYQMYHVALIGVDACGFNGNTDEGESPLSSSRSSLTRVQLQNSATDGCSSLPSRPSSVITTYSGLSRRSRMCGTAWQRRRGSRSRRGRVAPYLGDTLRRFSLPWYSRRQRVSLIPLVVEEVLMRSIVVCSSSTPTTPPSSPSLRSTSSVTRS